MSNIRKRMKKSETSKKVNLTVGNIAEELLSILPEHIGRDKAISKTELFYDIFDKHYQDNLSDYVRWDFVLKAMHKIRKQTSCFVIGTYSYEDGEHVYFVIKNKQEADIYVSRLKKNVKKINQMAKKAQKSVEEKWYNKPKLWTLPDKKSKRLN